MYVLEHINLCLSISGHSLSRLPSENQTGFSYDHGCYAGNHFSWETWRANWANSTRKSKPNQALGGNRFISTMTKVGEVSTFCDLVRSSTFIRISPHDIHGRSDLLALIVYSARERGTLAAFYERYLLNTNPRYRPARSLGCDLMNIPRPELIGELTREYVYQSLWIQRCTQYFLVFVSVQPTPSWCTLHRAFSWMPSFVKQMIERNASSRHICRSGGRLSMDELRKQPRILNVSSVTADLDRFCW